MYWLHCCCTFCSASRSMARSAALAATWPSRSTSSLSRSLTPASSWPFSVARFCRCQHQSYQQQFRASLQQLCSFDRPLSQSAIWQSCGKISHVARFLMQVRKMRMNLAWSDGSLCQALNRLCISHEHQLPGNCLLDIESTHGWLTCTARSEFSGRIIMRAVLAREALQGEHSILKPSRTWIRCHEVILREACACCQIQCPVDGHIAQEYQASRSTRAADWSRKSFHNLWQADITPVPGHGKI